MPKQKYYLENDAHFLADLPIEECVRRLERLNSDTLHIDITYLTSDTVDFTAEAYEQGRLRVRGTGALRRWEGTLTRVECSITVYEGVVRWLVGSLLSLLLFVPIVPFMLSFANTPFFWIVFVGVCGIGILWAILFRRFAPADDTPPNLLRMIEDALR